MFVATRCFGRVDTNLKFVGTEGDSRSHPDCGGSARDGHEFGAHRPPACRLPALRCRGPCGGRHRQATGTLTTGSVVGCSEPPSGSTETARLDPGSTSATQARVAPSSTSSTPADRIWSPRSTQSWYVL